MDGVSLINSAGLSRLERAGRGQGALVARVVLAAQFNDLVRLLPPVLDGDAIVEVLVDILFRVDEAALAQRRRAALAAVPFGSPLLPMRLQLLGDLARSVPIPARRCEGERGQKMAPLSGGAAIKAYWESVA